MKGILAKKIGMTQVFDDQGKAVSVTVVEAGPCVVTQKKTKARDGYQALQLGFGAAQGKRINKPSQKHQEPSGKLSKVLRELRLDDVMLDQVEVGMELKADIFAKNEIVKVRGFTIGKGFAGGIKRWNFRRQRMTHGCKARRLPGSMAATDRGGKIPKGKRMGGRLGNEKVTTSNLKVVDIEGNLILIRGSVPGPKNGMVFIYNEQKFDTAKLSRPQPPKVEAMAAPSEPAAAPAAVENKG